MYPYPYSPNRCYGKLLITIKPLDPANLNSITLAAKSGNATISGATICQSWAIYNLNYELGVQPMTQVGDALLCMVGAQPWAVVRFGSNTITQPTNGIIQALSYNNYFQNQIEVA